MSETITTEQTARCRWCDKNDIPVSKMAIFSYKRRFDIFTGVCIECIADHDAERKYHVRTGEFLDKKP